MPPKSAPGRGGGSGSARGGANRGRGGAARGAAPALATGQGSLPATHVTTVGVKRPGFGTSGRPLNIFVNSFATTIPENTFYHYDVAISPSEKVLPARVNMIIVRRLQEDIEPAIFTPPAVYDGRKNMFSKRKLFDTNSREFDVVLSDQRENTAGNTRGPKVYKVKITKVAEINPEVLKRFIEGQQSQDNSVLTAITALNVVIRMEPTQNFPFNVRSFFPPTEMKNIGGGITLCRGYFQSVRPGLGKMLINVDISTAAMFKHGPLIDLCLDFLGQREPRLLAPKNGLPDRQRLQLQRFITGLRISTTRTDASTRKTSQIPRVIRKLSAAGANDLTFQDRDGNTKTVAQFFKETQNRPLNFPDSLCVQVGSGGALIPIELCTVLPGQIMRKQVPPEKTKDVLEFATKKPQERLQSIMTGLGVLAYGQSQYVRDFGLNVDVSGPLKVQARVLKPPTLKYGEGSRQPNIVPANGSWNMVDKRFFKASVIDHWVVVVYERKERFNDNAVQEMVKGLVSSCQGVGITVKNQQPMYRYEIGHGNIDTQLRLLGQAYKERFNAFPKLIVAVLPEGGNDIYTAIKHFGDIVTGTATQCLKSNKCFRAKQQYYANVCLKINVKLGGINTIPDPQSVAVLTDPRNPTIVMGADVIHPAPGSVGRPSFTSLVASVDSDTAKYVATSSVQTSRQEIIDKLKEMCIEVLKLYVDYRTKVEKKVGAAIPPKRIIFYRDGVSEGQFQQVLDLELSLLKEACKQMNMNPAITFIVVGKRHHVRMFPANPADADRSGNCPAGTVVDREVSHPTEFDFYLQSHGGLLGTSRPAHYNVLYDDNKFSPDALQSLSFALCHVYARSTRSVSIPAPVYYADIVCSRAKNHYSPQAALDFSNFDTETNQGSDTAERSLLQFTEGFKPVNRALATTMYFS